MEQETSTLHLLQEHPLIVFIVGAVVLMAITLFVMLKVMSHLEKKKSKGDGSK